MLGQRSRCPPNKAKKVLQLWAREPLKGTGAVLSKGCPCPGRQWPLLQPLLQLPGKAPAHCSQHQLPWVSPHSRGWWRGRSLPRCEPHSGFCKALALWLVCLGQRHSSLLPVIKISVCLTSHLLHHLFEPPSFMSRFVSPPFALGLAKTCTMIVCLFIF